jgi:RNA polymerase sigma-70 factor, ECF subfamily
MAEDALSCDFQATYDIVDEDQMLVAAAQRDSKAAGRLYDKYYSEVFRYLHHCTFDKAVTEDLTSNVFLAAFQHLGQYRWRQIPFRAWLFRIATNEVRMHWRRQKRVKMIRLEPDRDIQAVGPSAAGRLEAVEEYHLVHQALLELRLKYRTVIILRYFEDKTISEICEITSRKEGTVKSQLHRGLARLQDILVRWGMLAE